MASGATTPPLATGGTPSFSGKGDAVSATFDPPASGIWKISHTGTSNFIVKLHCADDSDLIESSIGPMNGSGVIRFGQGPCFWEVEADGDWSLTPR